MIDQQQLYLKDSQTLDFEAVVIDLISLPDGRAGAILDQSYFYPTGGGQAHDMGFLSGVKVIDVYKDSGTGLLVHVIDQPLPLGPVIGKIDAERRQRHMQHHTAQHLLTQCFVTLFGFDTLSANINGYSASTLDLPVEGLSKEMLSQAENLANRLIYEDRPVRAFFVAPQELERLPLRRAPKVSEDIRIVEIDGFDYTPCGGTHCSSTGQIGLIKIVKTEKQNERTRVHFLAGWQALNLFQTFFDILSGLAGQMSIAPQDLPAIVSRQNEQLQQVQKDLQALRLEAITWEAGRLAGQVEILAGRQIVLASFTSRPVNELRILGTELARQPGLTSVLAALEGPKISLVVACGEGCDPIARELLAKLLSPFNGRGGGDARLAQGGGSIPTGQTRDPVLLLRDQLYNL